MADVPGCLACDLTTGRLPLPGGVILETERWRVEQCVGPLGVGTLLVKPKRHVTRIAELTAREAEEQGPLLHRSAVVLDHLLEPAQTYVCLWSHADGKPVHIHYVVQPISRPLMAEFDLYGPWLQAEMFAHGGPPAEQDVIAFAKRARDAFAHVR
jgi:diadenosine tetraphosphate (Ap4A) HIT family hydrolase